MLSAGAFLTAMLASCSAEMTDQQGPAGFAASDDVAVTVSFAESLYSGTRAADGQNSPSGFTLTNNDASKARIWVDNGSGSYQQYDYSVTGPLALTAPATGPKFPEAVNAVNVYGWYPAVALTDFTVNALQTNDATGNQNYCLSDLMVAAGSTAQRNGATSTPANLAFSHVMAKVRINLSMEAVVKVNSVKLNGVKRKVTVTPVKEGNVVTSYNVGEAATVSGTSITLLDAELTSSSSSADRTLCAVLPPQTVSGNFIEIKANRNDGTFVTMYYGITAVSATLQRNNVYDLTINVTAADVAAAEARQIFVGDLPNDGQTAYYDKTELGDAIASLTNPGDIKGTDGSTLTYGDNGYKVTITGPDGNPNTFNSQGELNTYIAVLKANSAAPGTYTVTVEGTGDNAGKSKQTTLTLGSGTDAISSPTGIDANGYTAGATGTLGNTLTNGITIGGNAESLGDTNGYTISIKDNAGNPVSGPFSSQSALEAALNALPAGSYQIVYDGQGTNKGASRTVSPVVIVSSDVQVNYNTITDWGSDENPSVSPDKQL